MCLRAGRLLRVCCRLGAGSSEGWEDGVHGVRGVEIGLVSEGLPKSMWLRGADRFFTLLRSAERG